VPTNIMMSAAMRTATATSLCASLLLLACPSRDTRITRSSAATGAVAREPPDIPGEFRYYDREAVIEAVDLIQLCAQSGQGGREARRLLAGVYEERGFAAAAWFYRLTFDPPRIEGSGWRPPQIVSRVAWALYPADSAVTLNHAVEEVARLRSNGEMTPAAERAELALTEGGMSLRMLSEWSDVVLLQSIYDPDEVSRAEFEIAVRTTLTSIEEAFPKASRFWSKASAYEQLADVFWARKDYPSALVAAGLALHDLRQREPLEEFEELARQRLARTVQTTRAQLRAKGRAL